MTAPTRAGHDQALRARGLRRVGWQIPTDVADDLQAIARNRRQPVGQLATEALEAWIDQQPEAGR